MLNAWLRRFFTPLFQRRCGTDFPGGQALRGPALSNRTSDEKSRGQGEPLRRPRMDNLHLNDQPTNEHSQGASVRDLLRGQAEMNPDAIAIAAPGRPPLCYRDLCAQIDDTVAQLNAHGLGRNDRVAIVLPNGPEMAVAFLAVASGATAAP